jgi:hypothetical protein
VHLVDRRLIVAKNWMSTLANDLLSAPRKLMSLMTGSRWDWHASRLQMTDIAKLRSQWQVPGEDETLPGNINLDCSSPARSHAIALLPTVGVVALRDLHAPANQVV